MYRKTADNIMELNPEIAILPVGSLEQHGPHLPVMTDWAIASEFGRRIAEEMGAFLIPALPISTCREQMGKKGSVWMEPTTFYQMMMDIVLSLKLQGFKKIGILQCHGGIFIMTPLVRDLNARYNPEIKVALIDSNIFYPILQREGILDSQEFHAGEAETSEMMAIAPETVFMDRAIDCVPEVPQTYLSYGSIFRASPAGVWGEPTRATAKKGEKIFQRGTELAVEELNRIFAYMEGKDKLNYSNF